MSAFLAAGIWVGIAWANPTTTYHFAPLVAAGVWPVVSRVRAGHALRRSAAVLAAAGGVAIVLLALAVLMVAGFLRGPALLGAPVPVEAVVGALAGGFAGMLLAVAEPRGTARGDRND